MSPERDGLEARVPGGKECHRHDGNNLEHPKFSCDDPGECADNNGGRDKTQTAKQIQHFAGVFGGNRHVSRSVFTAKLNFRTDLCHKRFICKRTLPIPSGNKLHVSDSSFCISLSFDTC